MKPGAWRDPWRLAGTVAGNDESLVTDAPSSSLVLSASQRRRRIAQLVLGAAFVPSLLGVAVALPALYAAERTMLVTIALVWLAVERGRDAARRRETDELVAFARALSSEPIVRSVDASVKLVAIEPEPSPPRPIRPLRPSARPSERTTAIDHPHPLIKEHALRSDRPTVPDSEPPFRAWERESARRRQRGGR